MVEERVQRRLAAILVADVVGYSRLMEADEAGTLAALKLHRKELIDPKTAEHGGRVVKLMGDGTLMEFGSVVDAVRFSVDVQCAMAARNRDLPEPQRILFRVGINIGDVIVDDDDIYGDGVNVAARLEGLAEPGGIAIARYVRDQIRDKLQLNLEDLGEVEVKNSQGRCASSASPWMRRQRLSARRSLPAISHRRGWSRPYAVAQCRQPTQAKAA